MSNSNRIWTSHTMQAQYDSNCFCTVQLIMPHCMTELLKKYKKQDATDNGLIHGQMLQVLIRLLLELDKGKKRKGWKKQHLWLGISDISQSSHHSTVFPGHFWHCLIFVGHPWLGKCFRCGHCICHTKQQQTIINIFSYNERFCLKDNIAIV